jgi:tetratricopeptide (TPR) repeat protein
MDHHDPDYSSTVADELKKAYKLAHIHLLAEAAACVRPLLSTTMTRIQRVRVLYILALAASADHTQSSWAVERIDEALELTIAVEDLDACTTLAYLGATTLHNQQHFDAADRYYRLAIDALRTHTTGVEEDRNLEYDLLLGRATEAFSCARYKHATHYLREAQRVPVSDHGREMRAARLEWLEALLARWRGEKHAAMRHVEAAYKIYTAHGGTLEVARLHIVYADVILDYALPLTTSATISGQSRILLQAEPLLLHALPITQVVADRAGEGMALLAHARYLAASDKVSEALHIVDLVEAIGIELFDQPLIAQVFTTRGAILAASGDIDAALNNFRFVLDAVKGSDALAYGRWARHALRHQEEMNQDADLDADLDS